jgi:hypothetical protein
MADISLNPCPFCNGAAEFVPRFETLIQCKSCGAGLPSGVQVIVYQSYDWQKRHEERRAADKWNTRPQLSDARRSALLEAAGTHETRVFEIRNDPASYKNGAITKSAKRASDFHERSALAIRALGDKEGGQ